MLATPPDKAELSAAIRREIDNILNLHDDKNVQRTLGEDDFLDDIGLGSLDLARLVSALEMEWDADPFAEQTAITSVRSVGDLVNAYLRFFSGEAPDDQADLDQAAARAARRRDARAR